jgi:hypothetical protein
LEQTRRRLMIEVEVLATEPGGQRRSSARRS